jgi:hypothetical protein
VIDWKSIRYTLSGLEAYYIGQRVSQGRTLHRFAVCNDQGETFHYYDEQGRHIVYGVNGWTRSPNAKFDIIEQQKTKTVTHYKWVSISEEFGEWVLGFSDTQPTAEDIENYRIIAMKRHEFTFEVPA